MTDLYLAKLEEENEKLRAALLNEKDKNNVLSIGFKNLRDMIQEEEKSPLNKFGIKLIKRRIEEVRKSDIKFGNLKFTERSVTIAAGRGMGHTTLAALIQETFDEVHIIRSNRDKGVIHYRNFLRGQFIGIQMTNPIIVFDDCMYNQKETQDFYDQINSIDSRSKNIPILVFLGTPPYPYV